MAATGKVTGFLISPRSARSASGVSETSTSPAQKKRGPRLGLSSAEAYFVPGEVLDKKGREQEAVESLKTTIQNDPQFSKPHYLLGLIYRKQGLQEEAKKNSRFSRN